MTLTVFNITVSTTILATFTCCVPFSRLTRITNPSGLHTWILAVRITRLLTVRGPLPRRTRRCNITASGFFITLRTGLRRQSSLGTGSCAGSSVEAIVTGCACGGVFAGCFTTDARCDTVAFEVLWGSDVSCCWTIEASLAKGLAIGGVALSSGEFTAGLVAPKRAGGVAFLSSLATLACWTLTQCHITARTSSTISRTFTLAIATEFSYCAVHTLSLCIAAFVTAVGWTNYRTCRSCFVPIASHITDSIAALRALPSFASARTLLPAYTCCGVIVPLRVQATTWAFPVVEVASVSLAFCTRTSSLAVRSHEASVTSVGTGWFLTCRWSFCSAALILAVIRTGHITSGRSFSSIAWELARVVKVAVVATHAVLAARALSTVLLR